MKAVLLVTQDLMDINVLHYLTMDDVFHCLAAYGGEGNRHVVCQVTLVSILRYRCDEGFLPVIWYGSLL